jgi:hypothetical protein
MSRTAKQSRSKLQQKRTSKVVALLRREAGSPASGHTVWEDGFALIENERGDVIARIRITDKKILFVHPDLTSEEESIVRDDWIPWVLLEHSRQQSLTLEQEGGVTEAEVNAVANQYPETKEQTLERKRKKWASS